MKEKFRILITYSGSRHFLILLTFTLALFALFERIGLFRLEPATLREVFHSIPLRAMSVLLLINATLGVIATIRQCKGWMKAGALFFYAGIVVTCC